MCYLTSGFCDISTDLFSLVLALLHEHGVALLSVNLLPDHRLIC